MAARALSSLVLAYAVMAASQVWGPAVIQLLHGKEARAAAAAAGTESVAPDLSLEKLRRGYDDAHFDSVSNCLHAGAMVAVVIIILWTVTPASSGRRWCGLASLLPVYYLPAWTGHFFLQKDIPAVFTYGTTWRGWACGEFVAFQSLLAGTTVSTLTEILLTSAVALALTAAVVDPMGLGGSAEQKTQKRA